MDLLTMECKRNKKPHKRLHVHSAQKGYYVHIAASCVLCWKYTTLCKTILIQGSNFCV